jgi:hypothetical protein
MNAPTSFKSGMPASETPTAPLAMEAISHNPNERATATSAVFFVCLF